jgi:proton glutamate symport protein
VNLLQPGSGVTLGSAAEAVKSPATEPLTFARFVEHLLPTSIVEAVLKGDVLQIVIFSTLFALGAVAAGERARPVIDLAAALSEVMFKVTAFIMKLAPLGVCAALAASVADHGWRVLLPLARLVGTLYAALFVFIAAVLLPALLWARIPLGRFVRTVKDPVLLAFATTSSESALPMAMERLESLGVPRRIGSFVLPLGYSFNLDGSTLYLAVASVFVAQAAGVPLSASQQLVMMLLLMLTTKGVAAVPRASLVVLAGTLTTFHLPLEGVALILGVDELMDMARTAVNLLGNCVATVLVARWEGISIPAADAGSVPFEEQKAS